MRRFAALPIALFLLTPPTAEAYVSPATGSPQASRVLRVFDRPEYNWLPGHRGVDLDLPVGAPVLAAGTGVIAFAGTVAGTPTVSLDHLDGIRTTYQPVHARVDEGDTVREGEMIGTLGHPTEGWPGLHWGARTGADDYLNPLSLLELPTVRLKPNPS